MNLLAGGSGATKAIITLLIVPLIAMIIVFFAIGDRLEFLPALAVAFIAFVAVYALMTRFVMMV